MACRAIQETAGPITESIQATESRIVSILPTLGTVQRGRGVGWNTICDGRELVFQVGVEATVR